jgi:hypothetical protein
MVDIVQYQSEDLNEQCMSAEEQTSRDKSLVCCGCAIVNFLVDHLGVATECMLM